MKRDLTQIPAKQAAEEIRAGHLSSVALVRACLDRIMETDDTIQAWEFVDPDAALDRAQEMDWVRKSGRATGALHGVPVGLKDVVDTAGMKTERGTAIFAGRTPSADACIVERLLESGAVILGKTRTTELAFVHPTTTTNPWDASRTPGGSSSGSAAAVAARQVPLAVGTQTNGSMIRPASFCGVFGLKPTRGAISRRGILQTSQSLDQVGVFGRSLADVALLADVLSSYDPTDVKSYPRPRPDLSQGVLAEPPVEPDLAWFDLPYHDLLEPEVREGMDAVIDSLGARVERFDTAPQLSGLIEVQATIHEYEFLHHLADLIDREWDALSTTVKPVIERARKISKTQYEDAIAVMNSADAFFIDHFNDFDGILAPSAAGVAPPLSLGSTGNPIFCTIWTLAGLPAVSMPALVGAQDLPVGLQLIGGREADDRLMRTASWLLNELSEQAEE